MNYHIYNNKCHIATNTSLSQCLHSSVYLYFVVHLSITSVLIVLMLIVNILLLCVLWRAKSTRKVKKECYGYYMINLCVIDLLAVITCTICTVLYTFNKSCHQLSNLWRAYSSCQLSLSSGWIATVAVMIMERFLVNKNPLLKWKAFQRMKTKLNIVWIWAIFISLPQFIFYEYVNVEVHCTCRILSLEPVYMKVNAVVRITSMVVLPSCIILVSSVGVLTPHSSESAVSLKRKKGQQQFAYLVLLLWVTFLCSNLPKYLFELVTTFNLVNNHRSLNEQIFVYLMLTSWAIYLATPFIYFVTYGKILKLELEKNLKRNSQRSANSNCSNTNGSLFSYKGSDGDHVECFLTRHLFQNIGILDGNMIQHLSDDICKEEARNSRRPSVMGDNIRKQSLLGGVMGENSRKYSLFQKRSDATVGNLINVMEARYFTALGPSFEHSVNTLNQNVTKWCNFGMQYITYGDDCLRYLIGGN